MVSRSPRPDYVFLGLTLAIVLLGLLFLSSASSVVAFQKFHDSYYYLKHQVLYGLLPGLVLLVVFYHLDYQHLRKLALPALIFSIVALMAVFLPGLGFSYNGARRWLHLGTALWQPSETIKLVWLVYLAAWLESRGPALRDLKHGFLPFVLTAGTIIGLILLQPDLGTMSVVAVSAMVTYFVAGANLWHMTALGVAGLSGLWLVIKSLSHSAARLTVFLNPELDPQGIGYHINQALLAVGSGGFLGLGLGYSRQKYQYLPEVTGDSIFAVVAEELGFIFTLLFLGLILVWLWRGFRIARRAPDAFGRYLAVGIVTWLGWQTCINIASMLNLLPLTGVPLPFVSAGGSALMTALAASGILANISRQASVSRAV